MRNFKSLLVLVLASILGMAPAFGSYFQKPSLGTETDPVFTASNAATIAASNITNWNTAYAWGNHAAAGYLTVESDPVFVASNAASILGTDIGNWDLAVAWGNHAAAGYLTVETDPVFIASNAAGILASDIVNWNLAYTWGNHAAAGYLTVETDPTFIASNAAGINAEHISNWNLAYSWGNHAAVGYLTVESDPVFTASNAAGINAEYITNWNTAYSWGNHAAQNYFDKDVDTAANVVFTPAGNIAAVTVNTALLELDQEKLNVEADTLDIVTTRGPTTPNAITTGTISINGTTGISLAAASGIATLAGIGNTNNENLLLNFESVADQVGVSSSTGVTLLDFHTLATKFQTFTLATDIPGTGSSECFFKDVDMVNPISVIFPDSTMHGRLGPISLTNGGLDIVGIHATNNTTGALRLAGYFGSADPTDSNPAIQLFGAKFDGVDNRTVLGADETVLMIKNLTTNLCKITGDGDTTFVGNITVPSINATTQITGTDYYSGDGTIGMTGSCVAATNFTIKDGLVTACA